MSEPLSQIVDAFSQGVTRGRHDMRREVLAELKADMSSHSSNSCKRTLQHTIDVIKTHLKV